MRRPGARESAAGAAEQDGPQPRKARGGTHVAAAVLAVVGLAAAGSLFILAGRARDVDGPRRLGRAFRPPTNPPSVLGRAVHVTEQPTSAAAHGRLSAPEAQPTDPPTGGPTDPPTGGPTDPPTGAPEAAPRTGPSSAPEVEAESAEPTGPPTSAPEAEPTGSPTAPPTVSPPAATGAPDAAASAGGADQPESWLTNADFEDEPGYADDRNAGGHDGPASVGARITSMPGWDLIGSGTVMIAKQASAEFGGISSGGGRVFVVLQWDGSAATQPTALVQMLRGLKPGARYFVSVSAARHRTVQTEVVIRVGDETVHRSVPLTRFRRCRAVFNASSAEARLTLQQGSAGTLLLDDVKLRAATDDDVRAVAAADAAAAVQAEPRLQRPTPPPLSEEASWPLFRGGRELAFVGGGDCGAFTEAGEWLEREHGWRVGRGVRRDRPVRLVLAFGCAAVRAAVNAAAEGLWPLQPAIVACAPASDVSVCAAAGAHRVLASSASKSAVVQAAADAAAVTELITGMPRSATSAREKSGDVAIRMMAVSDQEIDLEDLPDPEPMQWQAGMRWPDSCGERQPQRLYYAHARRRPGELTAVEYYDALRQYAAAGPNGSLVRIAALPGSALASVENDVPLADSHGGKHDLFRPWSLNSSCIRDQKGTQQCEAIHWSVEWHRNATEAKGPPQVLLPQPPLWVAVLKDSWLNDGYALACDRAYDRGGCQWNMQNAMATQRVDKAVVICDTWCNGYFHFLHEHLPRLAVMLPLLRRDPSIRVVLSGRQGRQTGLKSFVADFVVEVLGVPRDRLIVDTAVFARWTYLVQPQPCGNVFSSALHQLRAAVFKRLGLRFVADYPFRASSRPFAVLLAERRGTNSAAARMPRDWSSTKEKLRQQYNSSEVEFRVALSEGKLLEQVLSFHSADMVIGPHGANLANTMWMRFGTTVLEFMSYRYGNMCYYTTASRLGLRYRLLLHSALKGSSEYSAHWREVHRHIDDAIALAKDTTRRSSLEP